MMRLKPSSEQVTDLTVIASLGLDQVSSAAKVLSLLVGIKKPEALVYSLSSNTSLSLDESNALVRQVLGLNRLIRHASLSPASVVDALADVLKKNWNESTFENWKLVSEHIAQILQLEVIRLSSKALELMYDYTNLLQDTRILTDIRPLFSSDAKQINAAVISYTFRIEYESSDGSHEISLALDESDIRKLKEQCERAIIKAQTSGETLGSFKLTTIAAGKQDDN